MLTDTEREASFQSEQVWYYGFYKMVGRDLSHATLSALSHELFQGER